MPSCQFLKTRDALFISLDVYVMNEGFHAFSFLSFLSPFVILMFLLVLFIGIKFDL